MTLVIDFNGNSKIASLDMCKFPITDDNGGKAKFVMITFGWLERDRMGISREGKLINDLYFRCLLALQVLWCANVVTDKYIPL